MTKLPHSADTVSITFYQKNFPQDPAPPSCAGATVAASAWPTVGGASVMALTNVLTGDGVTTAWKCVSTWATAAIPKGRVRFQLKMTISGQVQIVSDFEKDVLDSNP